MVARLGYLPMRRGWVRWDIQPGKERALGTPNCSPTVPTWGLPRGHKWTLNKGVRWEN